MPAKDPLVLETVENTPTPEAYYHTILGLQFEKEENDPAALREYLEALQDDPNAVFLLNRAAILLNRIGNQKDALFEISEPLSLRISCKPSASKWVLSLKISAMSSLRSRAAHGVGSGGGAG